VAWYGLSHRRDGIFWSNFACSKVALNIPWWLAHSTPTDTSVSRLSITMGISMAFLNANAPPYGCWPDRL